MNKKIRRLADAAYFEKYKSRTTGKRPSKNAFKIGFFAGYKATSAKLEQLREENKRLRCCGNCSKYKHECFYGQHYHYCTESENIVNHDMKCDNWEMKE